MGIKYKLDVDEYVSEDLMIKANAERLVAGINASGTAVPLSVEAGGTGNATYAEGEFITYNSTLKKFVSSGISLPSSYSKAEQDSFFVSKIGGKYQIDYTNVVNALTMKRFSQTFTLTTPGASGVSHLSSPHGLGGRPDAYDWVLVCKALNVGVTHNWAIGDEIPVSNVQIIGSDDKDTSPFGPYLPAAQDKLGCLVSARADDFNLRIFVKSGTITENLTISFANLILNFDLKVYASRFA